MATNPQYPEPQGPQGPEKRSRDIKEVPHVQIVKKGRFPWPLIALIVAAAILAAIVAYAPRAPHETKPRSAAQVPEQPTGNQIQFTNLHIVAAPTGGAIYLAGLLQNKAGSEITGVQVEATFRGANGQHLETQARPIEALTDPSSNAVEDLTKTPIKPNESRPFRIYFDHPPAGWDRALPEIKVTMVTGAKA